MFKGAVLNIKFGPFYVFSGVFFTPLRYDYPSDVTLVLWQYGSRIRGGLLYLKNIIILFFKFNDFISKTRLHKSRSSRDELEFDLSNFV